LDSLFPAIFGVSPLHKLAYRASHEEYCRAIDQLWTTGACEWEDLGTGRRYRYSDETQKHVRLESLPAQEQHSVIEGAEALDERAGVGQQLGAPTLAPTSETKLCLDLLNGTIAVEEERLKRVTPTDFDRAYIKQLYERRVKLEASLAAA